MKRSNNRVPKNEYFFTRFIEAHKKGLVSKAAYFKARYEMLTDSFISSSFSMERGYESYDIYDKHPNYIKTKTA